MNLLDRLRAERHSDAGVTLVEVLVAVAILGIAGVAIMAGVGFTVKASDIGRKQANGSSHVRSLAEAIQNAANAPGGYQNCAAAGAYLTQSVKTQAGLPGDYTATQSAAKAWTGTAWSTCSVDNGSQQLTLTVTSPGSGSHQAVEALTVMIRKPCTGDVPTPTKQSVNPC